ncbi:MAG: hypothetical protein WDN01_11335 [Rhizomicrobium sp.]
MPCCTLIAFVLSQCGMAAGAVRTRLFGWTAPMASAGLARFRWPILAVALVFEMTIGAAAAPYIFTGSGRAEAARSIGATWHICKAIIGAG